MSQLVERVPAHGCREKSSAASQLNTPRARHQRNRATTWRLLQSAERHARSVACAADAEYRDCSCGGAAREAQSRACKITPIGSGAHGCLTPRSSGAPTAGHASHQALGLRPILRLLACAACRQMQLNFTLGIRKLQHRRASRKCACRREWNSHEAAKPQGAPALSRVISLRQP